MHWNTLICQVRSDDSHQAAACVTKDLIVQPNPDTVNCILDSSDIDDNYNDSIWTDKILSHFIEQQIHWTLSQNGCSKATIKVEL